MTPNAVRSAGNTACVRARSGRTSDRHPSSEPGPDRPRPLVLVPSGACRLASPSWPGCSPGSSSPSWCWAGSLRWPPKAPPGADTVTDAVGPDPDRRRARHPPRAASAPPSPIRFTIRLTVSERPVPHRRTGPSLLVPAGGWRHDRPAALKGKPVWINFMATYCPPCQDEFPLMNGFAARYADDGLVVLAIDVKEDEGTVAAFAESLASTLPLGLDAYGTGGRRLGRGRPAGPLLDRCRRHRSRRRPWRDRTGRHGPRTAVDPARRHRHALSRPSRRSAATRSRRVSPTCWGPSVVS